MKSNRTKLAVLFIAVAMSASAIFTACTVKYSLSGASIHPDAKTFSVAYFPNNAAMVTPILSPTFTDALKDRMIRQSKLSEVRENGDLSFEGEIVGYTTTPAAISGDEFAMRNRLTVTVKVRFKNALEPQYNIDRSFSAYLEYPTEQSLQDAEQQLIPDLVEILIDDIFNATLSNW